MKDDATRKVGRCGADGSEAPFQLEAEGLARIEPRKASRGARVAAGAKQMLATAPDSHWSNLADTVKTSLKISISQHGETMRKQRLATGIAVAEARNGGVIETTDAPKVRQIHKMGEVKISAYFPAQVKASLRMGQAKARPRPETMSKSVCPRLCATSSGSTACPYQ